MIKTCIEGKKAAEVTVDDVLSILQKGTEIEDSDTDEDLSIVTSHEFRKDSSKNDNVLFEGK